jgi:uncharacterized membrane protein YccC
MSLMLTNTLRAARRPGAEAQIDLSRARRWYSEDDAAPEAQTGETNAPETSPKGLDALPEEVRDYIRALRRESEERRKKLAAYEKAQREAEAARKLEEEKRLAEQGQWQKLAEERAAEIERLKQYEAQVAALLEATRKRNADRIARLPEAVRDLVPVDYEPYKLAAWLDANEGKLVKPLAPNLNPGQQSTGDGKKLASQVIKRIAY